MTGAVTLTLIEAKTLVVRALVQAGASEANAAPTAAALVAAEADGQKGHGLSRVPTYVGQLCAGKVDGNATPTCERTAKAALRIDAAHGFAFPAIDLTLRELAPLVRETGVAAAAITRSHHFGQAGAHVERLADQGLIGLAFSNSPHAMAFYGGARSRLGTNPIAFACPLPGHPPLVIDMALSESARGKVMAAKQAGEPIPEGWAVDSGGRPTTDPGAALKGSMLAIGGAKGSALALMVEILAAGLTASAFGWEASSFLDAEGGPPGIGHLILAIDPIAFAGDRFLARMATLLTAMDEDAKASPGGPRLPGARRLAARSKAAEEGLTVPARLHAEIAALTGD